MAGPRPLIGNRRWFSVLLALVLVTLPQQAHASERLSIFAAASLKTALDAVTAAWTQQTGKQTVNVYAASSALAKQIEAGAPADVFVSADQDWMNYLAGQGLVRAETVEILLGNTLVLIAPADPKLETAISPGSDILDVLDGGWLAMGEVNSVPAGKYGKAALEALGVWDSVSDRIAQTENVRAALMLVATGEAAAGIVYETDARAEPRVRVIGAFPDGSHPPIIYPVAAVSSSRSPDVGEFLGFLQSAQARDIFATHGFRQAPKN